VNIARLANAIYSAIRQDARACAQIRAEYSSLALQLATDPDASARITSATVNGQTFSAQSSMTNAQRMLLLRQIIVCIDHGSTISTTQLTSFGYGDS
jgi:hypothetical protein